LNHFYCNFTVELVKEIVKVEPLTQNSFGAGYLIEFYGGKPSAFGGPGEKEFVEQGLVLTTSGVKANCLLKKETKYLKLWKC
jgi:hypothetical protein